MLLLGLDLETGAALSAGPDHNFITEVGLVLWDTEFAQPVELMSLLLKPEQPLSTESIDYTGISEPLLARHGRPCDIRTLQPIANLMHKADYIVAHNGREFDRPLISAAFAHFGLKMPLTPWLDTQFDIDYPRSCISRNLIYLAGFHGMVNPFRHRAVTDVLTMLTILERYDLATVIANSQRQWLMVQAVVSYEQREQAKEKGFRWQSDAGRVYEKAWVKRVRDDHLAALQASCDFNLTVLERL
jgi:DNA polymerase-3 subunit epsilon